MNLNLFFRCRIPTQGPAILLLVWSMVVALPATGVTIYEHNFTGASTNPLAGVGVESGAGAGTLWTAEAAWFADGHAIEGVDGFDSANAFLPFVPESGRIYTLSATLTATGDTFNFMTLGFMNNPTVDIFSDQLGGPWMLKRGQQSGFIDEIYSAIDSTASANGGEDLVLHGAHAGATDLAMVLNTQLEQWTVEFFIDGNSVRGPANIDQLETPITHVGVSRYVSPVVGTVDNFLLTEVIEPLPFRLEVDRTTGSMTIVNETGASIDNVIGYSITSESGALDRTSWTPITGNYDAGGNQSVDSQPWTILAGDGGPYDLSEAVFAGAGGGLSATTPIDLGPAWIHGLEEDLRFQIIVDDGSAEGELVSAQVFYTPGVSNLDSFEFGDLDFDGDFDVDDFLDVFVDAYLTDTDGFSPAQAYQAGDFNNDGVTDAIDFVIFNQAYLAANPGSASLPISALGKSVPEPGACVLLLLGSAAILAVRKQPTFRINLLGTMAVVVLMAHTNSALAALSVTNGDFQTGALPTGTFSLEDVPAWNNSPNALRIDGGYDIGGGDELPTPAGDTLFAFETAGDYLYQSLGTLSENTNAIDVSYDAIERAVHFDFDDGNGIVNINRLSSSLKLDLFVGAFGAADGIDIAAFKTPVASATIEPLSMFNTIDTNDASAPEGPVPVAVTLEGIHFAPGEQMWLRVSSPDAVPGLQGASLQIDNLAVAEVFDPEIANPLTLQVNKSTGAMTLLNDSGQSIDIDIFRIRSSLGSLDPGNWIGIASPDWTTLGDVSTELSQAVFPGAGAIADAASLPLGNAYVGGENEDLLFEFHVAGMTPDTFLSTPVVYVTSVGLPGDFNSDGVVDAADYTVWRNNLGGPESALQGNGDGSGTVDMADYTTWKGNFGATGGQASLAGRAVVPEPSAFAMLAFVLSAWMARKSHSR